jgi:Ca-activated chloride channel homolog
VTLTGVVNDQTQTFRFPEQTFASDSRGLGDNLASLPRLWATRKIGFLLNQLRLKGNDQETIDQIVQLSIRYGIVTPYTSYLVTEPMPLGAEAQDRIAEREFKALEAAPQLSFGQAAVERAADQGNLAGAEAPAGAPLEAANLLRLAGSRTFVLNNGVWTDTAFDPDQTQTIRVAFLSDDYFALAQSRPDLAPILALGQQVIFLLDGQAYEVVISSASVPPLDLPPALTPVPGDPTSQPGQDNPASTPVPIKVEEPREPVPLSPACFGVIIPFGLLFLVLSIVRPVRERR